MAVITERIGLQVAACAALAAGLGLARSAQAAVINPVSQGTVIVFGDIGSSTSIAGVTLIGGNIASNSGLKFTLGSTPPTDHVLVKVHGDVQGGTLDMPANTILDYGGTKSGNVNGGSAVNQAFDLSRTKAGILKASADYAAANGSGGTQVSYPASDGAVVFSISSTTPIAIFNVDGNSLFGRLQNRSIDLVGADNAAAIVINVHGANPIDIMTTVGNGWSSGVLSKVLWNFCDTTSLTVDRQIDGTVLAPLASVVLNNTIEGGLVADTLSGGGTIAGPVTTVPLVPEPDLVLRLACVPLIFLAFRPVDRRARRERHSRRSRCPATLIAYEDSRY